MRTTFRACFGAAGFSPARKAPLCQQIISFRAIGASVRHKSWAETEGDAVLTKLEASDALAEASKALSGVSRFCIVAHP